MSKRMTRKDMIEFIKWWEEGSLPDTRIYGMTNNELRREVAIIQDAVDGTN